MENRGQWERSFGRQHSPKEILMQFLGYWMMEYWSWIIHKLQRILGHSRTKAFVIISVDNLFSNILSYRIVFVRWSRKYRIHNKFKPHVCYSLLGEVKPHSTWQAQNFCENGWKFPSIVSKYIIYGIQSWPFFQGERVHTGTWLRHYAKKSNQLRHQSMPHFAITPKIWTNYAIMPKKAR